MHNLSIPEITLEMINDARFESLILTEEREIQTWFKNEWACAHCGYDSDQHEDRKCLYDAGTFDPIPEAQYQQRLLRRYATLLRQQFDAMPDKPTYYAVFKEVEAYAKKDQHITYGTAQALSHIMTEFYRPYQP